MVTERTVDGVMAAVSGAGALAAVVGIGAAPAGAVGFAAFMAVMFAVNVAGGLFSAARAMKK
ncbi:hypothetical protein [Gemmata sp.]|uniref:hypothetical protein n=1 Tax=Gemmata sp. TaxID=1914242 RepID=UPI003F708D30